MLRLGSRLRMAHKEGGGDTFVFREGGELFPWRNLEALAVQCVREAV